MDRHLGRSRREAFLVQAQVQACHVLSAEACRRVEEGRLYREVVRGKQDLVLEEDVLCQEVFYSVQHCNLTFRYTVQSSRPAEDRHHPDRCRSRCHFPEGCRRAAQTGPRSFLEWAVEQRCPGKAAAGRCNRRGPCWSLLKECVSRSRWLSPGRCVTAVEAAIPWPDRVLVRILQRK